MEILICFPKRAYAAEALPVSCWVLPVSAALASTEIATSAAELVTLADTTEDVVVFPGMLGDGTAPGVAPLAIPSQ